MAKYCDKCGNLFEGRGPNCGNCIDKEFEEYKKKHPEKYGKDGRIK